MDILKNLIKYKKTDAIIITDLKNIRYLTNFKGSSAALLVTPEMKFLVTDFRYKEQAMKETKDCKIVIEKKRFRGISNLIKKLNIKKLCFEESVSYESYKKLTDLGLMLFPLKNEISSMREVKREDEIRCIREAIRRAESAFLKIKNYIKPGITESEIALRLEYEIKKLGSKRLPFEIIVASGKNSSMPHANTSEKKIEPGDLIVIDWGAEANGYFSDMTRTFLIDGPDIGLKKEIYKIVLNAQEKAIRGVYPGRTTTYIDRLARDYIREKGYSKYFGHGTGHGIGLDIHELPHISYSGRERLKPGMVFTIEPGIYIPETGGVRIEDMVLVTEDGYEILTRLPKDLEIIR